jgi:hypothetical protein
MNIQSIYICFIILVIKAYWWKETKPKISNIIPIILAFVLIIPLTTTENWYQYLGIIVFFIAQNWLFIKIIRSKELARVISTVVIIFISLCGINSKYFDYRYGEILEHIINFIDNSYPNFDFTNSKVLIDIFKVILGFYIVSIESNYIVLLVIKKIPSVEIKEAEGISINKNKGMGRIIGILERGIVFVLIVSSNAALIGFIIAVKALARFRELENKDFAEYFITGTMSSLLITISLSILVKMIL